MRPLNYSNLGHYSVVQASGVLTGTIGANGIMAGIRWAPPTLAYLVLMRIKAGFSVTTVANVAAPTFDLSAIVVRGFSVDFTVGTAISMVGVPGGCKMRATMGTSLLGAAGPRIATTVVMSGQTFTADPAPFAVQAYPLLTNVSVTGTATGVLAGTGTNILTLYEWTGLGQHPVVLSPNEGVVVRQLTGTAFGTGTYTLYMQWEWAEVLAF